MLIFSLTLLLTAWKLFDHEDTMGLITQNKPTYENILIY